MLSFASWCSCPNLAGVSPLYGLVWWPCAAQQGVGPACTSRLACLSSLRSKEQSTTTSWRLAYISGRLRVADAAITWFLVVILCSSRCRQSIPSQVAAKHKLFAATIAINACQPTHHLQYVVHNEVAPVDSVLALCVQCNRASNRLQVGGAIVALPDPSCTAFEIASVTPFASPMVLAPWLGPCWGETRVSLSLRWDAPHVTSMG